MKDQRTVRRRIAATVIAIGVVLFGVAVAPGVASAHHPVVNGTTSCRVDSWTVTWTVRADIDRPDLTWSITSPGGYSPSGSQEDSLPFTRTVTYAGSLASATETVTARWSNEISATAQGSVSRPPLCPEQTTTTTTTVPATTTTTTQPATTTSLAQQSSTTTTQAATTTTQVGSGGPTTTVGQAAATTTTTVVGQAAATTTTVGVGGQLPSTGGGSPNLTVIALLLIGIGAVMLRMASKPTR